MFSKYPHRRARLRERYPHRFKYGSLRRRYLVRLYRRLGARAGGRRRLAFGAMGQAALSRRLFQARLAGKRFRFLRRVQGVDLQQFGTLAARPFAAAYRQFTPIFRLRRRWVRFQRFLRRRVSVFAVLRHLFAIGKGLYSRDPQIRSLMGLARWDLLDLKAIERFAGRGVQKRSQRLYPLTFDALSAYRDRIHPGLVLRYLRSIRLAYTRLRYSGRFRRFAAIS